MAFATSSFRVAERSRAAFPPHIQRRPLSEHLMQGSDTSLARCSANRTLSQRDVNDRQSESAEPIRPTPTMQRCSLNRPLVWPHPEGEVRGESLEPLYPSAVEAAPKISKLYECLALVDALRIGRARETEARYRSSRQETSRAMSIADARAAIEIVAVALGELRDDVMFLGGAIAGLLVTNPAAPPPRLTDDVDVVVDVATYAELCATHRPPARARFRRGYAAKARRPCRWLLHGIKVDVMSTGSVPGPTNRWYAEAMANAQAFALNAELSIRIISRAVLHRRPSWIRSGMGGGATISPVTISRTSSRSSTAARRSKRMSRRHPRLFGPSCATGSRRCSPIADFVDAIAGHLRGDSASQARLPLVLSRMRAIAAPA